MAAFRAFPVKRWLVLAVLSGFAASVPTTHAGEVRSAEHITLTNGFDLICDHREAAGGRVKLFAGPGSSSFVEVGTDEIAAVETVMLPALHIVPAARGEASPAAATHAELTAAELHELLSSAGSRHNLDVNLLASLVRAESGGRSGAVSRSGAQGLMQLMPKTAAQLGVSDSLLPADNVAGGTAYLDFLLTRYHENLALALAAYNAGPGAVDRWHGVPPYRETRLYVARVIRDFNVSVKKASLAATSSGGVVQASLHKTVMPVAVTP